MPKSESADGERLPQRWRRTIRFGLALAILATLAGLALGYRQLRRSHLEKSAAEFFNRRDYANSVLVCRQILQSEPANIAATRLMAQIAGIAQHPDALDWFRRLETLQPTTENRLSLASAAIAQNQTRIAEQALGWVNAIDRNSAHYHQIAGALALAEKNQKEAANHFARAIVLEPQNAQHRLNFAALELAGDASAAEEARRALAQMAQVPAARLPALRILLGDALSRNDADAQTKWAAELATTEGTNFSDEMLRLEAAARAGKEAALLPRVETLAKNSPSDAAALIAWMNRHQRTADSLAWGSTLDKKIATAQSVPLALAESYSCAENWQGLFDFVASENWKEAEALRLTIASHATRHLSSLDSTAAENYWKNALKTAQNDAGLLFTMASLCHGWGYDEQAEEAWWKIAGGTPGASAALDALQQHYRQTRNAHGLLRVAQRALELNPDDAVAANNYASLGLLLRGDAASRRAAEDLHARFPNNAAFTATYAFALHCAGRTLEAMQALDSLPPRTKQIPAIAAYDFILKVAGADYTGAKAELGAAERASLLPEEEKLLAAALQKYESASGEM